MEALERPGCARCLGTCRCHTGESGLCQVFPGIQLRWTDSREPRGGVGGTPSPAAFEIRHCREGGAEWEWGDAYCCLSPGDLAIARQSDMGAEARFPLGRYRGITVTVDLSLAPEDFAAILPEVNVRPRELMEKFTAQGRGYVARSRPAVEHIFSELYDLPESIRAGYCKVKVLELLLFLSALGYGNGSKFAKAFREVMGTSPAAYRRQSQET